MNSWILHDYINIEWIRSTAMLWFWKRINLRKRLRKIRLKIWFFFRFLSYYSLGLNSPNHFGKRSPINIRREKELGKRLLKNCFYIHAHTHFVKNVRDKNQRKNSSAKEANVYTNSKIGREREIRGRQPLKLKSDNHTTLRPRTK